MSIMSNRSKIVDDSAFYDDKNICYLFDSGFRGNHVHNAFNALSLPVGAIAIYKYDLDLGKKEESLEDRIGEQMLQDYNTGKDKEHNRVVLTVVDRYDVDSAGARKFSYYPFRYGKILGTVKDEDGFLYVYVQLLHYIMLASRDKEVAWLLKLKDAKVDPPDTQKDKSPQFFHAFKLNTLNESVPLFTLSSDNSKDSAIWLTTMTYFNELAFFRDIAPKEGEDYRRDNEDYKKLKIFFYRFYITKASGSAKELFPVIEFFNIPSLAKSGHSENHGGADFQYKFEIDKKYVITLQSFFPYVNEDNAQKARIRMRIKLGNNVIAEQIYSDGKSTQRISFYINRRDFKDYSVGNFSIEILPYDDSDKSKIFIICAPTTEIKFEIKQGVLRRYIEPMVIAGFGAILLTVIEAVRALSANQSLAAYITSNWLNLISSLVINIVVMIPFVWLTKRDLLK